MNNKLELLEAFLNDYKTELVKRQVEYGYETLTGGQILAIDATLREIEYLKNK